MTTLRCFRCDWEGIPTLYWHDADKLGALCEFCERWIKWVRHDPEWLAIAPPRQADVQEGKGNPMGAFGTDKGQVTEGSGEFEDIADDTYRARITAVSAPFKDSYEGKESTKVTVEFLILPREDQDVPENYTRMFWLTLTDNFLSKGAIDVKSNLYQVLDALGYDLTGPLQFDSDEWLEQELRVVVGHSKTGFPKITGFMKRLAAKPARREPVAAGAASRPTRPAKGEEWDE